ncbi:palmitoyltransferase pfa4-like protein [Podospora appendiculata]|uniref:Palmitoyltransferase PFA4 n=1 Tax=Podospora appendiculata TaxID=314037 RepID=A0AAE1CHK3_9PEZI|nr:palmitoyltransferase pfa4-like protein [Podospora appendiculata]
MTNPETKPRPPRGLQRLFVPGVCILIAFLGYFSQWLFQTSPDLLPGPLTTRESVVFNLLLASLWYTYYKACTVDPGRYVFHSSPPPTSAIPPPPTTTTATRWCKKCSAPKPPRAHHCRHCGRCIPRMDHHCPWTSNCVSMQTFPHFLRFLVYTNLSLWTLLYFIYQRLSFVWSDRHLPAYLGPTLGHLTTLALLSLLCLGTALALGLLLYTTARGWVLNSTMIEDWEVERHEAVLARRDDDNSSHFWDGGDGVQAQLQIEAVEFPYDIGVFANMAQAMGSRNPLAWFVPFAGGPVVGRSPPGKGPGWEWEENGFNDRTGMWPPPDPDKLRRARVGWPGAAARVAADEGVAMRARETPQETLAGFARRQEADLRRRVVPQPRRREREDNIFAELEELDDEVPPRGVGSEENDYAWEGRPAWTNSEGDSLWDYGVDEDAELPEPPTTGIPQPGGGSDTDDDDNIPIAELIRRRKKQT